MAQQVVPLGYDKLLIAWVEREVLEVLLAYYLFHYLVVSNNLIGQILTELNVLLEVSLALFNSLNTFIMLYVSPPEVANRVTY